MRIKSKGCPKGKAKKIAFKLLGKPANMTEKQTAEKKKKNARLLYDDTALVR